MHVLYISTVLHFHMYVCYMLINESVSQSVLLLSFAVFDVRVTACRR